jgi:hypothetical protein
MHKTSRIFSIIFTLFLLSLASEHPLKAYADPGSGAMFVQILLAGIIGGLFRIRRVVDRVRRKKNDQEQSKFGLRAGPLARTPR